MFQRYLVDAIVDNKIEELGEGDSIYYRSSTPHKVNNARDEESVVLAVVYGSQ